MGVASSKASAIDASNGQPAVAKYGDLPASGSNLSLGTKRRSTDEATFRSPKRSKTLGEPGSHQLVDLAYRSPKPAQNKYSGRLMYEDVETCGPGAGSPSTDVPTASALDSSPEQSHSQDDGPRITTSRPAEDGSRLILTSPRFQHTIRSFREESEEVPFGWAVAVAPPIAPAQRSYNLTMIKKAVDSLNSVHLTAPYSRHSLLQSTTIASIKGTTNRSRNSRRNSEQPSGLAEIEQRNRMVHRSDPAQSVSLAPKRPCAEGSVYINKSSKWTRKTFNGSMQPQFTKRYVSKLNGIWRKDEWSGWSGILKKEH